jgi:predicted site-specific integrase-resolvase
MKNNTTSINEIKLVVPLKEAAEMMSMSRQTLMSFVHKGELTCVRLAKNSVWFRPLDLNEFIEAALERRAPLKIAG